MSVSPAIREYRFVIVDYDNLDRAAKARGLYWIVGKILEKIVEPTDARLPHFTIRLYGGWYEGTRLTRRAQDIALSIAQDVPGVFSVITNSGVLRVSVLVELAYSLAVMPARPLLATYRARSLQNSVLCHNPANVGCGESHCEIGPIYNLFRQGGCPKTNCSIAIDDVLYKAEQKLVDSMMLSDLIYYAHASPATVSIVTSDDDLWPGILYALHAGATVKHVRTRSIPRDHYGYTANLPNAYHVTTLS